MNRRKLLSSAPLLFLIALAGCTSAQVSKVNSTANTVLADGQLVCQVGPTFLSMVSPTGAALLAKGATAAAVAATCSAVNGFATALPALVTAIPTKITPPVPLPTAPIS